jgi:hypothetical protein
MMNQLTKGSKYKIVSASSTEENVITEGILEGFITMGEESALLVKMQDDQKEKLRIIPVNTILFIDVIEYIDEKKEEDKKNLNYIS